MVATEISHLTVSFGKVLLSFALPPRCFARHCGYVLLLCGVFLASSCAWFGEGEESADAASVPVLEAVEVEEKKPGFWSRLFGSSSSEPEESADAASVPVLEAVEVEEKKPGFWSRLFGGSSSRSEEKRTLLDDEFAEGVKNIQNRSEPVTQQGQKLVIFQDNTTSRKRAHPVIWRAALETVSFMGLSTVDPYQGTIATKWFSSQESAGKERIRVTIRILPGLSLARSHPETLIKRQRYHASGIWIDVSVSEELTKKLNDAIYTKAAMRLDAKDS